MAVVLHQQEDPSIPDLGVFEQDFVTIVCDSKKGHFNQRQFATIELISTTSNLLHFWPRQILLPRPILEIRTFSK